MKKITFIFALAVCALCISSVHSIAQEMVKVYRWYIPADDEYIISPEGEFSAEQIKERGWKKKTFVFYGYKERQPHSVAVYRWFNPKYRARMTIREDEFSEKYLNKLGWTRGRFQYYALTQANDNTVCVYRCRFHKGHSWTTITEDEYMCYIEDKEFQYYAVAPDKK